MVPVVQGGFGRFRTIQRAGRLGTAQQISIHVQDGNLIGGKTLHRGGYQMVDSLHILRRQTAAGANLHQYAGFGGLLRIQKYGILGKGQVDAGLLHFRQRHDRAFQFALQRPAVVDVLGELGGAQVGLIEQFETDPAGFGQARGGQIDAQFGQPRRRHHYRTTPLGQAVIHAGLFQPLDDGRGVFRRDAREQGPEIGLPLVLDQSVDASAGCQEHHGYGDPLPYR